MFAVAEASTPSVTMAFSHFIEINKQINRSKPDLKKRQQGCSSNSLNDHSTLWQKGKPHGTTWQCKICRDFTSIQSIYSRQANTSAAIDCSSHSLSCEDHPLRFDYCLIRLAELQLVLYFFPLA